MSSKNYKISEAAKLGRRINFWNWVENLALKMEDVALRKMNKYTYQQNELLNEITNDDMNETIGVWEANEKI